LTKTKFFELSGFQLFLRTEMPNFFNFVGNTQRKFGFRLGMGCARGGNGKIRGGGERLLS
jgi:hypothetical protein